MHHVGAVFQQRTYSFFGRTPLSSQTADSALVVVMKSDSAVTKRYRAIFIANGSIRKITFEALCSQEAEQLARNWGCGLEGEAVEDAQVDSPRPVAKEAFDVPSACQILGGISRTTLYRLLVRGKLERLPATRKVLVTRRSIERLCSKAA
jgi:hypothetical protein